MREHVKQALDQSTTRFLTAITRLLPGMVALIVALLISIVLAWILAMIVRRLLVSIRFDERLVGWGFPSSVEWFPRQSPTVLISRIVAALVIVTGLLIGVSAFDAELTSLLVRNVFAYVPNIVGAMLVLLVGSIIARFLARSVLIGAVNMNFQYGRLLTWQWLLSSLGLVRALWSLRSAFCSGALCSLWL